MVAFPPENIIKAMVRQDAPPGGRAGDHASDVKLPPDSIEDPVNNDVESGFHEKGPWVAAESASTDHPDEKGPGEPLSQELTLKHAVVLFSLTLLFLSAAAPLLLILSSLCMIFGAWVLMVLAFVVADLGGQDAEAWLGMANTLATAAIIPFVGAISDLVGRRWVVLSGLVLIMVGLVVLGLAQRMDVAIGAIAVAGVGAGLAEMIGFAGTLETIPVRARGKYLGILFLLYIPMAGCATFGIGPQSDVPDAAQLYSPNTWRWGAWITIIIAGVNFILIFVFYHPPPRTNSLGLSRLEIVQRIDFLGGFLSLTGFALFLMGLQWAGYT